MAIYELSKDEISFPLPQMAAENGLLAVGGDLSVERLLLAYTHGIFPWYSEGEPIYWWCPKERFVIFPKEIRVSKSMEKFLKKDTLEYRVNTNFAEVMHQCRMLREEDEGSWITDEMEEAYNELYRRGYGISMECYQQGELVGGLYGVSTGKCFFGESMFSKIENASKAALITLARLLEENGYVFIDCQFHTSHLESMGGRYISFDEYQKWLDIGLGKTES